MQEKSSSRGKSTSISQNTTQRYENESRGSFSKNVRFVENSLKEHMNNEINENNKIIENEKNENQKKKYKNFL